MKKGIYAKHHIFKVAQVFFSYSFLQPVGRSHESACDLWIQEGAKEAHYSCKSPRWNTTGRWELHFVWQQEELLWNVNSKGLWTNLINAMWFPKMASSITVPVLEPVFLHDWSTAKAKARPFSLEYPPFNLQIHVRVCGVEYHVLLSERREALTAWAKAFIFAKWFQNLTWKESSTEVSDVIMCLVVLTDKKKITESMPSFLWIRTLLLPYHCLAVFKPEKGRIYLKSLLSWMMIPSPHLAFGMLHFWSFRCISQLFARKLHKFYDCTSKEPFTCF